MQSEAESWTPTKQMSEDGLREISPSMSKYMTRDAIPYWSPTTQMNDESSVDPIKSGENELNLHATEWKPTSNFGDVPVSGEADDSSFQAFTLPSVEEEEEEGLNWASGYATYAPANGQQVDASVLQTLGVNEHLADHFRELDIESAKQMNSSDSRYKEIPFPFHSAFPLQAKASKHLYHRAEEARNDRSFGYPSSLYKVVDKTTNSVCALRRFDGVRTTSQIVATFASKWSALRHPNIVSLRNAFVDPSNGGGGSTSSTVFFTEDYFPSAQSLHDVFVIPSLDSKPVVESTIWSMLTQLTLGMKYIHGQNIAVRVVDAKHILRSSGNRVRYSSLSILDVLEFESRKSVSSLQKLDLVKLGQLMVSVAMRTEITSKIILEQQFRRMQQTFSSEICLILGNLLVGKIATAQQLGSIVCSTSTCLMDELENSYNMSDLYHGCLRKEYENGRLLRLLLKLGAINERPELTPDNREWCETDDRYVLKLFRDYVFHQCNSDTGLPVVDLGHMISCLNKVDMADGQENADSQEKILLTSRNNKDMFVVSYADINRCTESSFQDIIVASGAEQQVGLSAQHRSAAQHYTGGRGRRSKPVHMNNNAQPAAGGRSQDFNGMSGGSRNAVGDGAQSRPAHVDNTYGEQDYSSGGMYYGSGASGTKHISGTAASVRASAPAFVPPGVGGPFHSSGSSSSNWQEFQPAAQSPFPTPHFQGRQPSFPHTLQQQPQQFHPPQQQQFQPQQPAYGASGYPPRPGPYEY